MEDYLLHQTTTTTTNSSSSPSPTTFTIFNRLVSVVLIAIVSIWANYEASKGFEIIIVNDAGDTLVGRRFDLLFVSNDRATRIVLNASEFVEQILYPDDYHPRKPIHRVTLGLGGRNLTGVVTVVQTSHHTPHEYDIRISPTIMDEADVHKVMVSAVLRGMARLWLWDGQGGAPASLLGGMVGYISMLAGFDPLPDSGGISLPESDGMCWLDGDEVAVAHLLRYCEGLRQGFLARLNRAMKEAWHVRMVDDALGFPSQRICASYHSSTVQLRNSTETTSARQVV